MHGRTHCRRRFIHASFRFLSLFTGATACGLLMGGCNTLTASVDLGHASELEFSRDGRHLCLWEDTRPDGKEGFWPGRSVVIDLTGRAVKSAVDSDGRLIAPFAEQFPRIGSRYRFGEFLTPAAVWGFDEDMKAGVRVLNRPVYGKDGGRVYTAELWALQPKMERLWQIEVPRRISVWNPPKAVAIVNQGEKRRVILAWGSEATVLDFADGRVVGEFEYGPKVVRHDDGWVDEGPLYASAIAFGSNGGELAAGEFAGRRVRRISTTPPYTMLAELNGNKHSHGLLRRWMTNHVRYSEGGRYLVVDFSHSARGMDFFGQSPTYVVRLFDMKVIWSKTSQAVYGVVVSPDGSHVAYVRGVDMYSHWMLQIEKL